MLCVAMLLSVMVMGTGAVTLTDSEDISPQYREAAEVLTGMGIINGYEDDSFKPQQSITRAEVAAMIYRVATGDVEDEKADINAGAKIFTDVDADDWYAGYVNYCGDAEYIKGFEDDSFRADENVTGYQVLAMILRAVGYDKNNEFTGTNWTINVASTAMQEGLLKNVDGSVDLSAPATRELVAEFIFRAIHPDVETVHYVPAAGIYRDEGSSLGEQVFDLALDTDTTDDWGRPSDTWTYNTGDKETVIEEAALATFTVATSECDIATAMGVDENTDVTVWDNGVAGQDVIHPTNTTATLGAQGTLIEVYEDSLVIIDTYLALVTDVNEAEYDSGDHLVSDAHSDIDVWGLTVNNQGITNGTIDTTAYDEDAYILVNYNEATEEFYDVQEAESFVGAQTRIWTNAAQHTIGDTTYDDAAHYALDDAGNNTENFTWFLDQYGNVIGSVAIDRTGYAVLKDIVWKIGTPGYAEATLVYMDGSEATVEVVEFDGIATTGSWNSSMNDKEPTLQDSTVTFPGVSTDTKYNEFYQGYALYEVYTNDDGTVILKGSDADDEVLFDTDADIDTESSRIYLETGFIYVDDSTEFLVRTGDVNNYTYTSYDRNSVPDFGSSADIYYTVDTVNGHKIATRVYVKSGVEQAELGHDLFVTDGHYYQIVGTDDYYMSAVVDGVERTVAFDKEADVAFLSKNLNKLFHVTWQANPHKDFYGFVTSVRLVNEYEDSVANQHCDYLSDGSATIRNNTIIGENGMSYTLNSATVYVGADSVSQSTLKDHDIWVAYSWNGSQIVADTVYVGAKLSHDTSATVTATYNDNTYTIQPDADNADLYNIVTPVGVNSANITVDPTYVNAVVVDAQNAISHPWTSTMNADPATTWSLTIVAEDGVTERDITVSVKEADPTVIDNAVTYIRNGMNNAVLAENVDVYYDIEEAAANAITLTNDNAYTNAKLTIDTTYLTNTDLEIVRFTAGADAVNEDAFNSATAAVVSMSGGVSGDIQINDVESGTVVVVALTARDTEISDAGTVYFAFRVVNP